MTSISRRSFLHGIIVSLAGSSLITACQKKSSTLNSNLDSIGPLLPPDENGLMLPVGFSSRIIAHSGFKPHLSSPYTWHDAPDGGATFTTNDGGWIYVSNSEVDNNLGGVGAIQFNAAGQIINAYSILNNTSRNCAGGATNWKTWLSCEEFDLGIIWECDPYGQSSAIARPALGSFAHEAIALDTHTKILYMTEDKPDGCLYRYIADSISDIGIPDLSSGKLQIAIVDDLNSTTNWLTVTDPNALSKATRYQVSNSTQFNGGEGIVYYNGIVSFATKGDNRIWSYNTASKEMSIVYDAATNQNPILTGVDNLTITKSGELVVGEDGGDMQIIAISKSGSLIPLVQISGHTSSEVTGPSFSPDGKRLYFSSQRGITGDSSDGITFEVLGPYHN